MLVSVVVPCYNARGYVGEAAESVFAQTHTDLELICVDDGSTDGTADFLDEVRNASVIPMKVIRLERNSGACAARNAGLDVARGSYVQFLDSDDLLHTDKIAHQLELIEREASPVDLVTADAICDSAGGSTYVRRVDRRGPFFGLVGSQLGITAANLWRADAVRRVGGFNVRMRTSNEYELMFRMLKAGARVILDPVPKTLVRRRAGSLHRTDSRDFFIRFLQLRRDMLAYADSDGLGTPELRRFGNDVLFTRVRRLWKHDRRTAEQMYGEMLPPRFVPSAEVAGRRYRALLRSLGFARAQRVARLIRLSA